MKSTTCTRLAQASLIAAVIALTSAPAAAQQVNQPGFLGDVIGQFNALSVRPDPMGWDIGKALDPSMPDPTTCRHYEGIARVPQRRWHALFLLHPQRPQRRNPGRLLGTP